MPKYHVKITNWGRFQSNASAIVEAEDADEAYEIVSDNERMWTYDYDNEDGDVAIKEVE